MQLRRQSVTLFFFFATFTLREMLLWTIGVGVAVDAFCFRKSAPVTPLRRHHYLQHHHPPWRKGSVVSLSSVSLSFSTTSSSTTLTTTEEVAALSTSDIAAGVVLAVLLAGFVSFLQERQRLTPDIETGVDLDRDFPTDNRDNTEAVVSQPVAYNDDDIIINNNSTITTASSRRNRSRTTFNDWKDISRPDSYIWYNTRLRQTNNNEKNKSSNDYYNNNTTSLVPIEQRWVLFALVVLFAPIFSFEFFLTVSRQIICAFFRDWCLPYQ
jgi:hypothetical protein